MKAGNITWIGLAEWDAAVRRRAADDEVHSGKLVGESINNTKMRTKAESVSRIPMPCVVRFATANRMLARLRETTGVSKVREVKANGPNYEVGTLGQTLASKVRHEALIKVPHAGHTHQTEPSGVSILTGQSGVIILKDPNADVSRAELRSRWK